MGKCEPPKPVSEGALELSCILIDISGIKSEQYSLEQTARHDSLTGLLNRGAAQEKIRQYLFAGELGKTLYAYRQKNRNSLAALQSGAVGTRDKEDAN